MAVEQTQVLPAPVLRSSLNGLYTKVTSFNGATN